MAEITLAAETGRTTGTRASRRLRAEGRVPAVVYGHGAEPAAISVVWRELRAALSGEAGLNALITLMFDGRRELSIVKSLQRDPIQRTVTHVDFLLVKRDEELLVEVPIVMAGEALDVTRADGMVDQVMFTLPVHAKPADIPNDLTVDISGLQLGDTIRVEDVALPAGVRTEVEGEEPIVVTAVTRAGIEGEAEAEAGEAAEGEAGEAAEAGEGEAGGE